MKILAGTALLCAVAVLALAEKVRFDGHKVLKVVPRTARNVHDIAKMENEFKLDFWHFPKYTNDSFHVKVGPHTLEPFLSKLRHMEADFSVWIDDVQSLVDLEDRQRRNRRAVQIADPLNEYLKLDQITEYVENKALGHTNMHLSYLPNKTYENRDIQVVKIVSQNGEASKSIFIDCGIHAREWISPAFCLFAIDKLLSGESSDLLDKYNWHIVPVLNPDGYHHTHTTDRLWRKNRALNRNTNNCRGVDLNRNFGYGYNPAIGGSTSICSDIYTGTKAFSEQESDGLQRYILDNQDQNFVSYLTVHSYGQMWLHPWGYTSVLPDDVEDLTIAGNIAKTALGSVNGTVYEVGSSTQVLYSAAGGSDDWAKGGANIKFSYTLELRDTGRYGFVLPVSYIERTVIETWAGVRAMADHIFGF
ncbi:carboxypeptidase B-like [Mizuhopecten yessoensis]|uniref:Carboxypeptidase B n=1 Tax=Mizuhopecten yessoensis TaxID=6573 RepID=A0A210R2S0_MIZYE|nr:carboxypeptidase B-like [Mizuhopecten yessoensis]OWF55235.1 Carboxypeptidase B [Mizuhopecten yessoensis]